MASLKLSAPRWGLRPRLQLRQVREQLIAPLGSENHLAAREEHSYPQ